jgi:hypothetical protein
MNILVIAALLPLVALAGRRNQTDSFGADFTVAVSSSTFDCLLHTHQWAAAQIFRPEGGGQCDFNGGHNIALGVKKGVIVNPCITPNAPSMVSGALTPDKQVEWGIFCGTMSGQNASAGYWLDIFVNPAYPWPKNCWANNGYILEMIATQWKYSEYAGVYTTKVDWQQITCQTSKAQSQAFIAKLHALADSLAGVPLRDIEADFRKRDVIVSNVTYSAKKGAMKVIPSQYGTRFGAGGNKMLLLWYSNWNGQPNFNDFKPFGPFRSALIKQYNIGQSVCGIKCGLDWSPI